MTSRQRALANCLALFGFLLGTMCHRSSSGATEVDDEQFEAQVRPILVARCGDCHGDENPESNFRLTSAEGLARGGDGGPVLDRTDLRASRLWQALEYDGPLQMPPDGRLPDPELHILQEWIARGAPWPAKPSTPSAADPTIAITEEARTHWAFQPIVRPSMPIVAQRDWPQTGIDPLILASLESQHAVPLPAADRRTLIRRLYLDVLGVPPRWHDVVRFEQDPRPTRQVMTEWVDRLLASTAYGERWGRHWLDVARYADTKDGVLMYGDDRIRPYAYTYRDYVIRAMNEDTPFDQFVREQLAADRLEPPVAPWRLAAMGFLTLGRMFDNNQHDVIDDQIDVVSRGLLGLTIACARCHDHKYDPVATADYYGLYGVFANSEVPLDLPPTDAARVVPERVEFEQSWQAKRDAIRQFRDEQYALLSETARTRIVDYLAHVATTKPDPLETSIFFLSLAPEDLRPPLIARWRRALSRPEMATDPIFAPWHEMISARPGSKDADAPAWHSALARWLALPSGNEPGMLNPLVRAMLEQARPTSRRDLAQAYGQLLQRLDQEAQSPTTTLATSTEADTEQTARTQLIAWIRGISSPLYFPRTQTRKFMSRAQTDQYGGMLQELDRLAVQSPHATPRAMVLNDVETPQEPHILVRGNPSQIGAAVPRAFPRALASAAPASFGPGSGRLDLAQAITSPRNPLTARVLVNRLWMHHFGEPLVASPSDFGLRCEAPEQLAVLDYLASELMHHDWSLKYVHRQILLSATWQQVALPLGAGSGTNSVHRVTPLRQRLSFEAMRDTLLTLSGRLECRQGGRPIDLLDPLSRCRTVYGLVDRQNLPGMFRAFDFASPDQSAERRPRTMVPQQALFALNSPFVLEQARSLVAHAEFAAAESDAARIESIYRQVLARNPTPEEITASREFVAQPLDAETQRSTWELLAQVLLSSNELIYVD